MLLDFLLFWLLNVSEIMLLALKIQLFLLVNLNLSENVFQMWQILENTDTVEWVRRFSNLFYSKSASDLLIKVSQLINLSSLKFRYLIFNYPPKKSAVKEKKNFWNY